MSDLGPHPVLPELHGAGVGRGVSARLWPDAAIACVLARKEQDLTGLLGIVDGPRVSGHDDLTALGIGPSRWLMLGKSVAALKAALGDKASITDHSDGYAIFEIWGPCARDALAKGVLVDLDPAVFGNGVAVTTIAHIGAIVWQSGPERFAIAVFRSYAASFWNFLSASAAEYGLEAA